MKKTVVIRGKLFSHTQETIDSIRNWFDGEIIVSTWDSENTDSLNGYDMLIKTQDPGPGPIQQMKRQLISYKEGINNATGDLLLVTRSDMVHYKDPFQFFGQLKLKNEIYRVFDERVIIGNMMSIHPERTCPGEMDNQRLFRLNDWFQIGLKRDLEKWCDLIDIMDEYKDSNICTEQLWFGGCLKKYFDNSMNLHKLENYREFLWLAILNNFRVLNTKTTLQSNNKNWLNQPENLICYLMEHEYDKKFLEIFGDLK